MSNIPEKATRYYNHTYYAEGSNIYALYYSRGHWLTSFAIKNSQLPSLGVPCVKRLP
jgi:hypothetical protein